jgi:hypothetical protein
LSIVDCRLSIVDCRLSNIRRRVCQGRVSGEARWRALVVC